MEWKGVGQKVVRDLAMLVLETCPEHKGNKEIRMLECNCGKLLMPL